MDGLLKKASKEKQKDTVAVGKELGGDTGFSENGRHS